jgi:hypothetical protein
MKIEITAADRKKYPLPEKRDIIILKKVKLLEKMELNKTDRDILRLIKTQLEDDWRKPLIVCLNKLLRKYK